MDGIQPVFFKGEPMKIEARPIQLQGTITGESYHAIIVKIDDFHYGLRFSESEYRKLQRKGRDPKTVIAEIARKINT